MSEPGCGPSQHPLSTATVMGLELVLGTPQEKASSQRAGSGTPKMLSRCLVYGRKDGGLAL